MKTYYKDLEDNNQRFKFIYLKHLIISKINMFRNLEKYIISIIKMIEIGWGRGEKKENKLLFISQLPLTHPTQKKTTKNRKPIPKLTFISHSPLQPGACKLF